LSCRLRQSTHTIRAYERNVSKCRVSCRGLPKKISESPDSNSFCPLSPPTIGGKTDLSKKPYWWPPSRQERYPPPPHDPNDSNPNRTTNRSSYERSKSRISREKSLSIGLLRRTLCRVFTRRAAILQGRRATIPNETMTGHVVAH